MPDFAEQLEAHGLMPTGLTIAGLIPRRDALPLMAFLSKSSLPSIKKEKADVSLSLLGRLIGVPKYEGAEPDMPGKFLSRSLVQLHMVLSSSNVYDTWQLAGQTDKGRNYADFRAGATLNSGAMISPNLSRDYSGLADISFAGADLSVEIDTKVNLYTFEVRKEPGDL